MKNIKEILNSPTASTILIIISILTLITTIGISVHKNINTDETTTTEILEPQKPSKRIEINPKQDAINKISEQKTNQNSQKYSNPNNEIIAKRIKAFKQKNIEIISQERPSTKNTDVPNMNIKIDPNTKNITIEWPKTQKNNLIGSDSYGNNKQNYANNYCRLILGREKAIKYEYSTEKNELPGCRCHYPKNNSFGDCGVTLNDVSCWKAGQKERLKTVTCSANSL